MPGRAKKPPSGEQGAHVVGGIEKLDPDKRVAYVAGTVLRVKWPLVDGAEKCWFTAIISAVSERTPPRRKRSIPSEYRYTLFWRDGTPALVSRLLHLPHRVIAGPRCKLPRRFIKCGTTGRRHELPTGIFYNAPTRIVSAQLKVRRVGASGRATFGTVTVCLGPHPNVQSALEVTMMKRMELCMEQFYRAKKAKAAAAKVKDIG